MIQPVSKMPKKTIFIFLYFTCHSGFTPAFAGTGSANTGISAKINRRFRHSLSKKFLYLADNSSAGTTDAELLNSYKIFFNFNLTNI